MFIYIECDVWMILFTQVQVDTLCAVPIHEGMSHQGQIAPTHGECRRLSSADGAMITQPEVDPHKLRDLLPPVRLTDDDTQPNEDISEILQKPHSKMSLKPKRS